jgi:GMP synthase-like glutamine amidotransferase
MTRRDEDADASGEGTSWLVLRHAQAEGIGLLGNALRERGIHHRALDIARGEPVPKDLRGVGGLIVLGGPMGAYEQDKHAFLRSETALLEKAIAAGRPVLGICLGAQLIAQVLGARVYPGEKREVGWAPVTLTAEGRDDPLFAGGEPSLTVFHLHGDTYELPPDAANLATSTVYEQQAFRWGEIVYGFQFHLEFTESIITRLAQEPDSQRYMTEAGADVKQIVADTPGHVRDLTDTAQRVFESYFSQCGL